MITKRPLLILYILFGCLTVHSQTSCKKCDTERVRITQENLDSLTFEKVLEFLCIFDESCQSDYEFYQISNENLFDLVYNAPELFLKVLQYGDLKNHERIMDELSSPAHEAIDVEVIRNKIEKLDDKYMFKYDVLSALD